VANVAGAVYGMKTAITHPNKPTKKLRSI